EMDVDFMKFTPSLWVAPQLSVRNVPAFWALPSPMTSSGSKISAPSPEGTAKDALLAAVEVQPPKAAYSAFLRCDHRVRAHLLHHHLVHCCLQGQRPCIIRSAERIATDKRGPF
ncbi:hypothetical protein P4O66_021055, partial [Electrophorus voltai]